MKRELFFLALFAMILAGCNKGGEKATDTHDDEIKIKLTAYTTEFELFAEADPFVVGESSHVLSHFTHLPEFSAVENGSITIRLIIEGRKVSQQLTRPTRKGIYSFDIIPATPGKGQIIYDIATEKGNFQMVVSEIMVFDKHSYHDNDSSEE
ncbi:MAG: hypothetical protein V1783_11005, partial [Bacteroidota bacterium]